MNLGDVMDAIATRLDTIDGLRCFAYPPDTIHPPAGIVTYPEGIEFDTTYGRGSDRITLPVVVAVGRVDARSTRELVAGYADGSGAASVKAVLESGSYTAFDSIRVTGVEFDTGQIGGVDYLIATFTLDIVGSGS